MNNRSLSNQKWKKANNDRIGLEFPKGKVALVREYAARKGLTFTAYVKQLIEADSGIPMGRNSDSE